MTKHEKSFAASIHGRIGKGMARVICSDEEAIEVASALATDFAVAAAQRDAERILPSDQVDAFSKSGLWAMTVPAAFGGADVSYRTVAKVIEIISAADPSIGQIPQNHLSNAFLIRALGTRRQQKTFFDLILRGARIGNALAELTDKTAHDLETRLRRIVHGGAAGYELTGLKFYSTGALFADYVSIGAIDENGKRLTVIVPRAAPGLTVVDDWSSFGQRTTASGTVILDQVFVPEANVFAFHRTENEPVPNGAVAQIIQAAIDSGIAVAAVEDTERLVREMARPWRDAGQAKASDDLYTIAAIGRLRISLHAAQAMLERAGDVVDRAISDPNDRTVAEASVAVAEAKVLTTQIALDAGSTLFELVGTRSTLDPHNFDRHWRNARVHTLHDPVRWKYNVVGDWFLNGKLPPRHGLV